MIIDKWIDCGKETLVLQAQQPHEGKTLEAFALPGEPLIAEIRNINGYGLPDLVIRKAKDL